MVGSVNTASITPETAVKSTKDRNNNQNTSSLKTRDLPFDSVEFKSAEKNRQKEDLKKGGFSALVTALTIFILARKPKVKTLMRVSKDNPNLKRYLAIDLLNSHLKDGAKLSYDATKQQIKKVYKQLAVKFHPDKCKSEDKEKVENIFKDIVGAYTQLK